MLLRHAATFDLEHIFGQHSNSFFSSNLLFRLMPILSGLLNFPLWFGHFTKVKFYICKCNLLLLVHHIFTYFLFHSLNMTYSKAWWNFLENRTRWPENGKNYSLLQYSMEAKAKRAIKPHTNTHIKTIHLHRKTNSNN